MPNEGSYQEAKRRSDATWEKLQKNPHDFSMLTGDRPTGHLHLGHWFGTLKERVRLQNEGVKTNVLIADYQVITDRDTTEAIQKNTYDMVLDYLAAGLDPEKTMIFTHSAVPALNQLMLPFLSLVTESELQRNPTVKAEQLASNHVLTGLLLTYPVHQACDILFCKANVVPVGKDQLPHLELTRNIARRFNDRFAPVFVEPTALLSEAPVLLGLDGQKMSKSYGNAIELSMSEEETAKLIKKARTDSERTITYDPVTRPGVSALIKTASLMTGEEPCNIASSIGDAGAGALKAYVTEVVNDYLRPFRTRRAELAQDKTLPAKILEEGNRQAREIADATLDEVRSAMGMVYSAS